MVALVAALALTVAPANAKAAAPVLEFVVPDNDFPVDFEAEGGEVTAALAGFDTVVHCTGSDGEGEIVGPRATLSNWVFTGCETQTGSEGGAECKSEGAADEEIRTGTIEAELVFIDQAKRQVGMLLNPGGGVYMSFECGEQSVKALGPFLSPVGPINEETASFTATLSRSGATQTPSEYENAVGEKRQAIPMGERNDNPLTRATTGVELGFAIETSVPLEIKAITAAEIEARRHEDEAAAEAAVKKRQEDEAAAAAAAKRRQEEEAAAVAATKRREQEEAKAEAAKARRLLSKGLTQCRKAKKKQKRVRCEKRVKKQYGGQKASKK